MAMLTKRSSFTLVTGAVASCAIILHPSPAAVAAEHVVATQPATTQATTASSRLDAVLPVWIVAKASVQDHLTSPSTASFGSQDKSLETLEGNVILVKSNAEADRETNSKWYRPGTTSRWFQVEGWVDAQNLYGATVRNYFRCSLIYYAPVSSKPGDLKHDGKEMLQPDRWRIRSLEINPREELLLDRVRHLGAGQPCLVR
jgi:hypothetical protein